MHQDQGERVVVIGGGLGGLSAAVVLAGRGYRVTLLERNAWVGGKACELREAGYRFDMGPTILTMPEVLRRVLGEAGRDMAAELDLVRLDPQWRCFFEGGEVLDLREQLADMQAEIAKLPPAQDTPLGRQRMAGVAQRYAAFLDYAQRMHEISERFFFWKSIGGLSDMFEAGSTFDVKMLSDLKAMRMGRSMAGTIRRHVQDPRLCQLLDHFTQYVGSSPFGAPAVLCGIASMQLNEGVWYPMGGTRAVPSALERVARELGVEIRTGEQVAKLVTDRRRVTGVVTERGERIACAAVVSNMDSVRTYRELVGDPLALPFGRKWRAEPACSGVVLYLGLSKRYEHLAHHDFVFSRDPHEEFEAIYHLGEPAPDPTCYLAAPAATEPGVAPEGGEALYVLVHTPFLRHWHDWQTMFPRYRQTILEKLKRTGGMPDIEERIVFERALTPQDIHDRYQVLNGAIYGLASHGKWTGAFKPANRSPHVEGLYLAGGAAHPGPGMPMVLMSGWIAADALDTDGLVEKTATPAAPASAEVVAA